MPPSTTAWTTPDDHERILRRVTVDGDVPAGVDGRRSLLLAPESVPEPAYGIASGASTDGAVAEA